MALFLAALVAISGLVQLDLFGEVCTISNNIKNQEFKLEYQLSYCGDGKYCETIIDLRKRETKVPERCSNDPYWEDETYSTSYSYFVDYLNSIK